MTAEQIVASYYQAWQTKHGDLSEVPLADDFQFSGPVASFNSAEGYRTMAAEAGQAVTSFRVRRQFVDEGLAERCGRFDVSDRPGAREPRVTEGPASRTSG